MKKCNSATEDDMGRKSFCNQPAEYMIDMKKKAIIVRVKQKTEIRVRMIRPGYYSDKCYYHNKKEAKLFNTIPRSNMYRNRDHLFASVEDRLKALFKNST